MDKAKRKAIIAGNWKMNSLHLYYLWHKSACRD